MKVFNLLLSVMRLLLPALFSVIFGGCDTILQYPDNDSSRRHVMLTVEHIPPGRLIEYEYAQDEGNRRRNVSDVKFKTRYILDIYPSGSIDKRIDRITIVKDENEWTDFRTAIDLPYGEYDVWVWADRYDSSKPEYESGYFCSTDNFAEMRVPTEPYVGDTEMKDALCGTFTIAVTYERPDEDMPEAYVQLSRPLTSFAFIATDLREFVQNEIDRSNAVAGTAVAENGKDIDLSAFDLSGYTARLHYEVYHPTLFNMFVGKPVDSTTDVSFNSRLRMLENNEVLIGFDYFFINGANSSSTVSVTVYNPAGKPIASTPPVKFRVQRNCATIIRGKFLTTKTSGAVGVHPEFDGSFNYPLD